MIIEVRGLEEIINRMRGFPQQYSAAVNKTMQAVLLYIWSKVPGYPPASPNSSYIRTGTLGRSLGSSIGGGRSGQPDIYQVVQNGGFSEARFGSRLQYAPRVIGDRDLEQAAVHQGRWWTIPQTLLFSVEAGIRDLFRVMAEELAAWLEGRGS